MNKVIHNMIGPKGKEKLPCKEEIQFLYEVMNGKIIDYALVIWCIMRDFLRSLTENRHIPFLTLVKYLVEAAGIRGSSREKRVLPRLGVTPRSPIRPEWRIRTESGARDYLLGLSLSGSFSEMTPVPVFSFICTIYVITKNHLHTYKTTTGVVSLKIYTHILSPIYLDMYISNTKHQRLQKQCGEHLSLNWPALLMWDVLSSILVFCFLFSTYTD